MRHGHLSRPVVAYETWGKLNYQRDNAICFSLVYRHLHAASSEDDPSTGWWEQMIGDGKPMTRRSTSSSVLTHLAVWFYRTCQY